MNRRSLLKVSGSLVASVIAPARARGAQLTRLEDIGRPVGSPAEVAADEQYWERIRRAFPDGGRQVWLAHGAGGAVPVFVLDHMARCAAEAGSGAWEIPVYAGMKESGSSKDLRQRMGRLLGCDPEEIALTRNAMEGLATCLLGYALEPGDEVLTTTSDYDSCIAILKQRERRDGIRLRLIDIPTPILDPADVVAAFERAMTPRTRMVLISHMTYGTGQVLPVAEICALARRTGALSIVDAAHGTGHLSTRIDELGCDCMASCLHKWFLGPRGSGLLHIRKDRIPVIWPLLASYSNKPDTSIEKFEEVGTVNKAVAASLPLAFDFNERIGLENKEARLRYLRDRWAIPFGKNPRVRWWTNLAPERSCGVGAFHVDGLDSALVVKRLAEVYGLKVRSLGNPYLPQVRGINVGLSLVNTAEHADRFVDAVEQIIRGNRLQRP